jgi:hypothetical protein
MRNGMRGSAEEQNGGQLGGWRRAARMFGIYGREVYFPVLLLFQVTD